MATVEIVSICVMVPMLMVLFWNMCDFYRNMKKWDEDFAKLQRQIDALPRMTPEEEAELLQEIKKLEAAEAEEQNHSPADPVTTSSSHHPSSL